MSLILSKDQICECAKPIGSGRRYLRFEACVRCGLLIAGKAVRFAAELHAGQQESSAFDRGRDLSKRKNYFK